VSGMPNAECRMPNGDGKMPDIRLAAPETVLPPGASAEARVASANLLGQHKAVVLVHDWLAACSGHAFERQSLLDRICELAGLMRARALGYAEGYLAVLAAHVEPAAAGGAEGAVAQGEGVGRAAAAEAGGGAPVAVHERQAAGGAVGVAGVVPEAAGAQAEAAVPEEQAKP
jgi:hypothetical protein